MTRKKSKITKAASKTPETNSASRDASSTTQPTVNDKKSVVVKSKPMKKEPLPNKTLVNGSSKKELAGDLVKISSSTQEELAASVARSLKQQEISDLNKQFIQQNKHVDKKGTKKEVSPEKNISKKKEIGNLNAEFKQSSNRLADSKTKDKKSKPPLPKDEPVIFLNESSNVLHNNKSMNQAVFDYFENTKDVKTLSQKLEESLSVTSKTKTVNNSNKVNADTRINTKSKKETNSIVRNSTVESSKNDSKSKKHENRSDKISTPFVKSSSSNERNKQEKQKNGASGKVNAWKVIEPPVVVSPVVKVDANEGVLDEFLNLSIDSKKSYSNPDKQFFPDDKPAEKKKEGTTNTVMFGSAEEIESFKEQVKSLLVIHNNGIVLKEFASHFAKHTGTPIKNWFKQTREKVPKPLALLQNFCDDLVEIEFLPSQSPMIRARTTRRGTEAFREHIDSMSSRDCEKQLNQTVQHMQGSSKSYALSIDDDDDDVVEVKTNKANTELDIQSQIEKFLLYRDFQMIHITYVKLRVVSVFSNNEGVVLNVTSLMQAFKAMFCENFFSRVILKHFVSDSSHLSENFVKNFLSRFCTDFLSVDADMTVRMTINIPSAHVKFLNQLITALEKLSTPGNGMKSLDPTPAEMMLLGKSVTDQSISGIAVNTKVVRNRHQDSTFLNFPNQMNFNEYPTDRPTIQEVNERVNQIRNRICREGRCVKLPDVIQELCQFYKVSCVGDLYPIGTREIRREGDIPALYEIMQIQGKVNAFVQAFIEFRNICTLHELEEEVLKMENKSTFNDLKIGPLQKQLIVYEYFKFPPDKDMIPPITTLEVFRLLWKCQSEVHRNNKCRGDNERDRLTLHQFMDFFIKQHGFNDPFESGVRINSIGLAISVVRKAWFGDMHNIRSSVMKFTQQLCVEFDQHLRHASTTMIGKTKGLPGEPENLVQKIAGMNLLEGFGEMYGMLQKMKKDACKTLPGTAHLVNFSDITMNALSVIQKDELMRRIFHVLLSTAPLKVLEKDDVTVLNSLGFKKVIETMLNEEKEKGASLKKDKVKKAVASKATITNTTKKWFSKNPDLNLEVLSNIEAQVTTEVGNYESFDDMGHGSFLKFVIAEKKLYEIVENSFGMSDGKNTRIVSKKDIINFVKQCGDSAKAEEVLKAISHQFCLPELTSSVQSQITEALESKDNSSNTIITYQHAFLCGSDIHEDATKSDLSFYTQTATKKITSAPYLMCLDEWTNWNVMFEKKLGPLKTYLQSFSLTDTNFIFMEVTQNKFIKIMKDCPFSQLLDSLKKLDAYMTSTSILSILMASCHINDAPIALLSNHIQKALLEHAGKHGDDSGDIIKFSLQCFALIPFDILCSVVQKLFLNPLAEIFGSMNVAEKLLHNCLPYSKQRRTLQLIGLKLSIEEWKTDYNNELNGKIDFDVAAMFTNDRPVVNVSGSQKIIPVQKEDDQKQGVAEEQILSKSKEDKEKHVSEEKKKEEDSTISTNEEMVVCQDNDVIVNEESIVSSVMEELVSKVLFDCPGEEISDPALQRYRYCASFIRKIQREQFGVGLKFGVEEGKLIEIFRERQGRSLHRLSQELYTKDSHFVLELIQNADDNEYPDDMLEKPTVAFIVESDKITILNNEKGFQEKHVKALCDVGKSTKGIHRKGYIGQKGIGFKSVFRVTDCPQIHSNGFHIMFDALSGPNGYICPQWVDGGMGSEEISYQPPDTEEFSWTTKIVLPLKTEMQHSKLTSRFHDIHPSLLMFLNRLQTIIIDDKVTGSVKIMRKEIRDESMIRLTHNDESSLWLAVSKEISIDIRDDVKTTGISVAFPIEFSNSDINRENLPVQPVFAFLPLRSYGFKFIIQADFEVPSSREDIDKDSSWNQCILRHIPQLVVDAFHFFKGHSYFSKLQGVIDYFKFMDVEDHVLGVFKQVGRNIIKSLQRESCLPIDLGSATKSRRSKAYQWMIPSSVILSQKETKDVIDPDILSEHLGLHYVHEDVQKKISSHILKVLGVSKISIDQLVEVSRALVRQFNERQVFTTEQVTKMHSWIGQWLHVIYKTLQENCDCSQQTLNVLKSLHVFALSDGKLVSLNDTIVFFPVENQNKNKVQKEMGLIENDLSILSRDVTSKLDQVEKQQVMRLLKDLGVKLMTPFDLIHNNIIPIFKNGKWKGKSEELLAAFVTYLHKQHLADADLFDISDIKDSIVLQTNKGLVRPCDESIYFSKDYNNTVDLMKKFPACKWTLISDVYIKDEFSNSRRKQWEEFFAQLGLQYFALLQEKKETLHKSDIVDSVWEKCSEEWPSTPDETYVIHDLMCPEFTTLLASKQEKQIEAFALELDKLWQKHFSKYNLGSPKCCVENTSGKKVATAYSTFSYQIRTYSWLRSSTDSSKLFKPNELYVDLPTIRNLFSDKVNYLTEQIKEQNFIQTMGVLTQIPFEKFIELFKKWRQEKLFGTSFQHTIKIYEYLRSNMTEHPKEICELLEENFVFLLTSHCNQRLAPESRAEGSFHKVRNVCWEDPSGIIVKSNDVNQRRVLKGYYPDEMRIFFVNNIGVDRYPSTKEYLNLVYNLASKTTLPDKDACFQICTLFSVIGNTCVDETMRDEVASFYLPDHFSERVQLFKELQACIDPQLRERLQSPDICEEKIFPTASNTFASLSQKPLLAFNNDLAPIFKKEENVPIIFIDQIVRMLKRERPGSKSGGHHKRAEESEQVKHVIRCICLFKACGMELLSDVYIPPEVITVGMSRGCRKWEQILHDFTPFIQRYMSVKLPGIYRMLKNNKFEEYLKNSTFFAVQSLEVIYRLKDRPNVNVKELKVCSVELSDNKGFIYITEKHVDDKNMYETILSELMTLFVGKGVESKEILLDFALVPNKRSYLNRKAIFDVPHGDAKWSYPEPEKIVVAPPPEPTPVAAAPNLPTLKNPDGDAKVTHWPPRKPGTCGVGKPDSVRKDEEEMLEKWKQPDAPGMDIDLTISKVSASDIEIKSSDKGDVLVTKHIIPSKPDNVINVDGSSSPSKKTTVADVVKSGGTKSATSPGKTSSKDYRQTANDVVVVDSDVTTESEPGHKDKKLSINPADGLKRKREPSGVEHEHDESTANRRQTDNSVTPKTKRPFSPSQATEKPNYDAPVTKNVTTNKVDLSVLGHTGLDLETEYEDLPYYGNKDLEEGELPSYDSNRQVDEDANLITSKLGEEIVFRHLCNIYKEKIADGTVKVEWLNSEKESKSPYDLMISFSDADKALPIYIEVKTTVKDERREFQISSQQLKFAFTEGQCFHLYRVSNIYRMSELKIKRLVNLSAYMDRKAVKLFMLL